MQKRLLNWLVKELGACIEEEREMYTKTKDPYYRGRMAVYQDVYAMLQECLRDDEDE